MKQKTLFSLLVLSILLLNVSCTRSVIPEEVLQIPEFSPVYTSCNLWYNEEGVIRSENIQQGTILPFGSEVEFLESNAEEIRFRRISDGKKFCIRYDKGYHLLPVEEFIKRIFVLRNEKDLVLGIRPIVREKIKRGIVEKGMTRQEVILAFGPPCAFKTPARANSTWVFWEDFLVAKRVVFNEDAIVDIFVLE